MSKSLTRRPHPKSKFERYEDEKLKRLVAKFGTENWNTIAHKMKDRTVRQCRERWLNYLDPNLNKSEWTDEEDKLLYQKFDELGRRWKVIASFFENRTDISVKNRWLMLERHRIKAENQAQNSIESAEEFKKEEEIIEKEEELRVPENQENGCELKDVELIEYPLSVRENSLDFSDVSVQFPVLDSLDDWFIF